MKKIFTILLLASTGMLMAQTPQFYNFTTVGTANSFPFNMAAGKMVQWLIKPGEYNQPTPSTAGNITKFYFFVAPTYPLNSTYTQFYIKMGRSALTNLPAGQFYNGPMDTVFYRASGYNINAPASTWWEFVLDEPFAYYPDSSLIIEIGQCSSTQGTGFSVNQNTTVTQQRLYSVGGCPFVYGGAQVNRTINSGITVAPAVQPPNLLYFKFENSPSSSLVLNCALNPVGNNPAPLAAATPLNSGGQFDTCISGTGLTNGGVTPGWNWNTGQSGWTISMWITIPSTSSGSAYYLFGDAGVTSFRCFHNGVAGQNNLVLRGPMPDVNVTGIGPAPTVVTFVYDSVSHTVKAYKNGVLANTVSATLTMTSGTGFRLGGYGSSATFIGKMDEFRVYKRALDSAEVLAVYNMDIACALPVGTSHNYNQTPNSYKLEQNYPNPFNPATKISFAIPKAGHVKLIVYDILGREVAVIVNEFRQAGNHSVVFDGENLSSGIYFYSFGSGDFKDTKKMTLIK
jgi:hypothetical protein